jgi:hypothetical protein
MIFVIAIILGKVSQNIVAMLFTKGMKPPALGGFRYFDLGEVELPRVITLNDNSDVLYTTYRSGLQPPSFSFDLRRNNLDTHVTCRHTTHYD